MWGYEKRLQFPVNITSPNAKLAQAIISQYGGPDGEMGASMRYLSQRYAAPYREVASILTDIGVSVPKLRIIDFKCTPERRTFRSFMMVE
ncbi:MAG: manganese containing catalase [Lachnospiraceae bacterium]|nr:manganese containing catalase [Lachnospiraceae bacterium]